MTSLPYELSQAIEMEVSKIDLSLFSQALLELSLSYRNNEKVFITSLARRLAYIGVRLPATYSAILSTLLEIKNNSPSTQLTSLLDLGAGPGTTLWAALTAWPEISKVTLVERDREMISLGKTLASNATNPFIHSAQWLNLDLTNKQSLSGYFLRIRRNGFCH
ncbi:MAG: ribosomal small subunit Rsm22 [bacterium]|nr:MAG: ribosomal small subunit Rsm22 [bacterium]